MNGPLLIFQPEGKRCVQTLGTSLLEAARQVGVDVQSICGGRGACGKCRILIRDGDEHLNRATAAEKRFLSSDEIEKHYRLACFARTISYGTLTVEVPSESRIGQQRLVAAGIEGHVELSPAVMKLFISLPKPSLSDIRSDSSRVLDTLREKTGRSFSISHDALGGLPDALRKGEWNITLIIRDESEIVWVEPGKTDGTLHGFAVDIGTTKLAGYLVDLAKGKIVATSSLMNPQIPRGEDVVSRISYGMKDPGNLKELQQLVATGINQLLRMACDEAGIDPVQVYDMTAVGNTAMHHIFLGINPSYVALSPYPSVAGPPAIARTRDLRIDVNPGANVFVLPTIAGFVGADAVAVALSTEIYKSDTLQMAVDIGTNTEIILGDSTRLTACSCASGPAFEGAHIKHGMRAATGAIERIWIDPTTLELGYRTVDDAKPTGICGSAMVDAVAEMLKARIMDSRGRLEPTGESLRVRRRGGTVELVIAWKEETETGEDIVLTQEDVREIQLAKAAIYTGSSILMTRFGAEFRNVQSLFIAGAFGTYVDPQSARTIGMYPDVELDRIQFVGNAAGSGARMALMSMEARRKAESIARKMSYIELAGDPDFQKEFVNAMYFPNRETERFPSVKRLLNLD